MGFDLGRRLPHDALPVSPALTTHNNGSGQNSCMMIEEGSDHTDVEEVALPYVLLRNLGSGGCGIVEEVQDVNTGLTYARKVFLLRRRNREWMKEVFQNEVDIIKSLGDHPHLIHVFATYTTKDQLGLILSPVADQGDLDRFLGESKSMKDRYDAHEGPLRFEIDQMASVLHRAFGCLASGLDYMHQRRIRHKDIKAHNILIHHGHVIYTDFGLSFDSNMFENSTTDGPADMTRRYAAPEVVQGLPRNSSSDIFSLGCVFVEIFAALKGCLDYDEREIFSRSLTQIRPQLRRGNVETPLAFLPPVILAMISHDPGDRCTAVEISDLMAGQSGFCCSYCLQRATASIVDKFQGDRDADVARFNTRKMYDGLSDYTQDFDEARLESEGTNTQAEGSTTSQNLVTKTLDRLLKRRKQSSSPPRARAKELKVKLDPNAGWRVSAKGYSPAPQSYPDRLGNVGRLPPEQLFGTLSGPRAPAI